MELLVRGIVAGEPLPELLVPVDAGRDDGDSGSHFRFNFPDFVNDLVICDGKETGFLCFHSQFECTCVERKRVCVIRPFSLKGRSAKAFLMQHATHEG